MRLDRQKCVLCVKWPLFLDHPELLLDFSGSGKANMDPALINFKVLYVLTQLCGLTMIVLVATWIGQHFGGLAGTSNPGVEFNWHPLFMTIGFIYLYGNCE